MTKQEFIALHGEEIYNDLSSPTPKQIFCNRTHSTIMKVLKYLNLSEAKGLVEAKAIIEGIQGYGDGIVYREKYPPDESVPRTTPKTTLDTSPFDTPPLSPGNTEGS